MKLLHLKLKKREKRKEKGKKWRLMTEEPGWAEVREGQKSKKTKKVAQTSKKSTDHCPMTSRSFSLSLSLFLILQSFRFPKCKTVLPHMTSYALQLFGHCCSSSSLRALCSSPLSGPLLARPDPSTTTNPICHACRSQPLIQNTLTTVTWLGPDGSNGNGNGPSFVDNGPSQMK